jgi:3',5'-cyclic AMP phosphodiesterase CpdA
MAGPQARLLAVSDLHVAYPQNREIVQDLRPASAADWLLLAGDTGEFMADIEWALGTLSERFGRVIWVPGNHDLWTHPRDPVQLRGEQRYRRLVEVCRNLGVPPRKTRSASGRGPAGRP